LDCTHILFIQMPRVLTFDCFFLANDLLTPVGVKADIWVYLVRIHSYKIRMLLAFLAPTCIPKTQTFIF
jgi:hypothetical protein